MLPPDPDCTLGWGGDGLRRRGWTTLKDGGCARGTPGRSVPLRQSLCQRSYLRGATSLLSAGNITPQPVFSGHPPYGVMRGCDNCARVKVPQDSFCSCPVNANLKANTAKPLPINLSLALVSAAITRLCVAYALLIFFFCWLKLSMMTPMKRFNVKKDPKMMKITKYKYMYKLHSHSGCSSHCKGKREEVKMTPSLHVSQY